MKEEIKKFIGLVSKECDVGTHSAVQVLSEHLLGDQDKE
jgi:hypothetical protein